MHSEARIARAGKKCVVFIFRRIVPPEEVELSPGATQQQLEQQEKQLENMQESARKAGLGSSVYEP
jgi:hypothetical protein